MALSPGGQQPELGFRPAALAALGRSRIAQRRSERAWRRLPARKSVGIALLLALALCGAGSVCEVRVIYRGDGSVVERNAAGSLVTAPWRLSEPPECRVYDASGPRAVALVVSGAGVVGLRIPGPAIAANTVAVECAGRTNIARLLSGYFR